jgi:hypothetical protein
MALPLPCLCLASASASDATIDHATHQEQTSLTHAGLGMRHLDCECDQVLCSMSLTAHDSSDRIAFGDYSVRTLKAEQKHPSLLPSLWPSNTFSSLSLLTGVCSALWCALVFHGLALPAQICPSPGWLCFKCNGDLDFPKRSFQLCDLLQAPLPLSQYASPSRPLEFCGQSLAQVEDLLNSTALLLSLNCCSSSEEIYRCKVPLTSCSNSSVEEVRQETIVNLDLVAGLITLLPRA